VTFEPSGISATEISSTRAFTVDTVELHGLISNERALQQRELRQLYDYAPIDVFDVNYEALPADITPQTVLWAKTGIIGDVVKQRGKWFLELRQLLDLTRQTTVNRTSLLCRAEFGGPQCRADLTGRQFTGTVTTQNGTSLSVDITGLSNNDLRNGRLDTAGGLSFDIINNAGSGLTLADPPSTDLIGQTVTVTFGCNKMLDDCERYDNVVNYFGEPYVPTSDQWASGFFTTVSV
jgi:uncharacterized phage protein (TIGR02218 family)